MGNLWMFLQQTGAAALTALFLLVVQRIFLDKLSPRWQYGVWSVLLLRLVVPAGIGGRQTALDLWPWVEQLRVMAERGLASAYASPWQTSLPTVPWPLLPKGAPVSVTDWLFLLYFGGVILTALWFVLCALRLHLRVGKGVPVAGERLEAVQQVAQRYDLPLPRQVVECRWEHGPFLMGVLRPTLVLPMGWELDEAVVLHELMHLKYRDVLAGWVTTLFRCLHWCNPILWLVFDKIGNDRESLCDQRVLERLEGEARRDYGRALLAMADDKAVRVPGATTMANGARAVKARIEAIARFKRYPQGMALVSQGITLVLALSLVAGAPVQALLEREYLEVTTAPSVSEALSTGQLHRPTTLAGALDAYGKGVLLRWDDPYTSLMCSAMVRAPEDMPQVLEEWETRGDLKVEAWDASTWMEKQEILLPSRYWWTTGPQYRGLVSDGQGGYLCQVLWYRDVDESLFWAEDRPLPEEGELWPVDYLCHTVWVRPEGKHWTVTPLAETRGELADAPLQGINDAFDTFPGPVTWVGEAEGVRVSLSPAQLLESGEGLLGQDELRNWGASGADWGWWSDPQPSGPSENPMPSAYFCSIYERTYWTAENIGDSSRSFTLKATPLRQGRDGLVPLETVETMGGDPVHSALDLATGEILSQLEGDSGASGSLGDDENYFLGPDSFQVVLEVDGREVPVTLTKTYTTPDGGSYTLPGEEMPK